MIPPDVLQSNRDLTSGERHHIKQLAKDTDAKLKAVRKTLDKLQREEKDLLKTAANCQLALAPVRILPRDMISEIFLECVRGEEPSMYHGDAPVLLTHICSDFRNIALSMPMLWTTIALKIPLVRYDDAYDSDNFSDGYRYENPEHGVEVLLRSRVDEIGKWTHRSGTLPLSIELAFLMESHMFKRFEDEQQALAEVLLKSAARWRHLSVQCVDGGFLVNQIMQLMPDEVPLLTSLLIDYQGDEQFFPGNIFQARNLMEFSLRGEFDRSSCHVNWSQLTRLALCRYMSTGGEILRHTQNLVHLSLTLLDMDHDIDDIYLPCLRELSVWSERPPYPDDLFAGSHIHAPALETLRADDCIIHLTNLIKRSQRLHNLEVRMKYSHILCTAWLRNCPQITSLVIDTRYPGPVMGLIEELVLDHEGTYICPNLRKFRCTEVLEVPFHVLCQFLGVKHGRSNTLSPRKWEQVDLKVYTFDWGTKKKIGQVLNQNKVVQNWESGRVLRLQIMNPGQL